MDVAVGAMLITAPQHPLAKRALCLTDADKARLVARPLREFFPSRTYGVLVRKGKSLSGPARAFVDLIKPGLFKRKDWFEAGHSER